MRSPVTWEVVISRCGAAGGVPWGTVMEGGTLSIVSVGGPGRYLPQTAAGTAVCVPDEVTYSVLTSSEGAGGITQAWAHATGECGLPACLLGNTGFFA